MTAFAASTSVWLRWQCGSNSTPITTLFTHDRPCAPDQIRLAIVAARGDHGAVQEEQRDVERTLLL